MLCHREIRGALWAAVRAFLRPKIVVPLLAYVGWILGLTALARTVGLWQSDAWSGTVAWFLTAGLALFFSLERMTEGAFFRTTVRRAIAATVFLEGFINLAVLPLPAELVLLPIVTAVGAMAAFTERRDEYAEVQRLTSGLMSLVGGSLLLYVTVRLATDFEVGRTFRALVLPVWLSIASLPFVYPLSLWAAYERAFALIHICADDPRARRRAKFALLRAANVRASEVADFNGHWVTDLAVAETPDQAQLVARRWRQAWHVERRTQHLVNARASMQSWLAQTEPELAAIQAEAVEHNWKPLDTRQRASLKAEGLRLAPQAMLDEVRALPD